MAHEKPRAGPFPGTGKTGADYEAGWEKFWKGGIAVGQRFDMAGPHKGLTDLIQRDVVAVREKTILVPGCGRGYDAIALAEGGGHVTGLEISETAVAAAEAHLKEHNATATTPVDVTYSLANFFEHRSLYDVGYDDTFFCALHPDQRQQWGTQWAQLVKPDGRLIVVVFPIVPEKKDGPPWHIDPQIVTHHLHQNFEVVFEEKVPEELSERRRIGIETIMIFKKK